MERFKYIDSLRGIAILLVIISHSHPYFAGIYNYSLPIFFESFIQNGDKGVTLFFFMSAFTLCMSLNSKKQIEFSPIRNYFIRRFFRIAPLYYFIIALNFFVDPNSRPVNSLIANIFFIHGTSPNWMNSTVQGGWSVGIEVMFYCVFPVLFFKLKNIQNIIILTLITLVAAKITTSLMFKHPLIEDELLWSVFVYENFISQLPVFLMGMALFHIQNTNKELVNASLLNKSYLYMAIFLIIHLLGGNIFKIHYLFAIAFGFASFSLSRFQPKLIVNKITIWIGKLSYSIYLIHLLVAKLLVSYNLAHYTSNSVTDFIVRFLIIFSISIAFSHFTYKIIEIPFQEYGKRLIIKLEVKDNLKSRLPQLNRITIR